MNSIRLRGVSENNLKHIDLDIPKEKLVVVTGVSGSGKSSLVFDTLAAESERQWLMSYPLFLRNRLPHHERPSFETIEGLTPSVTIDQRAMGASVRSTVGTAVDIAPLVRLLFSRVGTPSAGGSMAYSFNHPMGMCPDCTGLGKKLDLQEDLLFNPEGTLRNGGLRFSQFNAGWQNTLYVNHPRLDPDKPLKEFTAAEWQTLKYGDGEPLLIPMHIVETGNTFNNPYEGVVTRFRRLYVNRDISKLKKSLRDEIATFVTEQPCPSCGGTGLNPAALASKINGMNIADFRNIQVSELLEVIQKIDDPIGKSICRQIAATLQRMVEVGIGYLTLGRRADTLSGGEIQRLKIVRHLGSSLSGVTYIFDEPTAGLHPEDSQRIARLLLDLRDKQNTVIVVEHNEAIISLADYVIEIGPLAGEHGGEIVFQGSKDDFLKADTLSSHALREPIHINEAPVMWTDAYAINHARLHNLKDVNTSIPKGVLTVVCGVAGSGKSSLVRGVFAKEHSEAVVIDQKPIGTSSRSTPATYTGVMDLIRRKFAEDNGVDASWFSSNSKGACPVCGGKGVIHPDVAFADPVEIPCEECHGKRFNAKALSYLYRGKNIHEVLMMTIDEATAFFEDEKLSAKLRNLCRVGLGYMTLGQQTSSMSGGEIQRLKLASHLDKKGQIYLLDEPSTGLHHHDIKLLLSIFRRMTSRGNTVVLIEHRPDIIADADWIIEMGPHGGNEGGKIIAQGTPQQIACNKNSIIKRYINFPYLYQGRITC